MPDLKIGNKVMIITGMDVDKTGEVIAKDDEIQGRNVLTGKTDPPISFWKVKLDKTGEVKRFANDQLDILA